LLQFKPQIEALPISTKQAECTIQRFMLYLLPVFNLAYNIDAKQAHQIVSDFSKILIKCPNFSVQSKVTSLLHMYNACQKGIKALIFIRLTKLCSDEGCFDILSSRARDVVREQEPWELTIDEQKELYS
jgi:hypothetical protein